MICTSKTGVLVYGELAKEPEFKRLQNGSYLMKLNIRYDSEKNEAGKWLGKFIDVNIWRVDVDLWDDMLHKGDNVIASGKKVEPHEYNGKTYYQLDAEDVTPSGKTQLRWLQQAINAVWSAGPTPAEQPSAAPEPPQPEPQQQVAPPAPRAAAPAQPAQQPESPQPARQYTEDEMRIIEGDDDDLPF